MPVFDCVTVVCPRDKEEVEIRVFYASNGYIGQPVTQRIPTGAFCAKGQALGCNPAGCPALKRIGL